MQMQSLFDDDFVRTEKCRTCEHRERWHYNSVVIQYCGVTHDKRTANGLMKIKASRPACHKYLQEVKDANAT